MGNQLHQATRLWTLAVPTVSAFITALVTDFAARDDVLQETAVAVLQDFDRYDPERPFVAWAIGIARNQVRLYLRRRSRDRLAFDSDTLDALALAFADSQPLDARLEYLGDCVEELENRARALCELRYEQDLAPAEIGARLGMAANTVAKALQRIRERLRGCIEHKAAAEGRP